MTGPPTDRSDDTDDTASTDRDDVAAPHRVVFTPSGLSGTVEHGVSVLAAARRLGVDLDSVCGGRGICGRCQIEPATGRFDKWAIAAEEGHLSPSGKVEETYLGWKTLADGRRLGCDARILGDAVIDVPASSQIHRQVVRKDVALDGLVIDPVISLHYLELPHRADDDGTSETERIANQLAVDWGIEPVRFEPSVLPLLHRAAADDSLTVAVSQPGPDGDRRVRAAWPGFVDRAVGVAIDVGSTTIAGHLCDLSTGEVLASAGRMNPQIRFGEDLMSRVSYVMMNPDGRSELTDAVQAALGELVGELLDTAGDGTADTGAPTDGSDGDNPRSPLDRSHVLEVVLVGNPVMHHLFLGIDPTPLGLAPFPLATDGPVNGRATDVGIDAPAAALYVAPCVAGHVGADTAAAILAEGPHRGQPIQLLVDVGTNAEIVLGNAEHLLAASSPTGPAFEGAQISAGQRATAGAIERVRVDRSTLEPRFKVIGCDAWSDEDAFAEGTRRSGVTGICGSGIIEVIAELFLAGVIDADGLIVDPATLTDSAAATERIVAQDRTFAYRLTDQILVTQGDVRAIQLAKAALRAGIDLLLERAELTKVDEIRLAGAFGAHIDPVHAMVLGLVPDCPVGRVRSTGNSAGSGAVRALLAASQREEMEDVVRRVTKIETATEPRFQELFVAALALPHRDAPNPELSSVVDLPARAPAPASGGGRRRRRARSAATDGGRGEARS